MIEGILIRDGRTAYVFQPSLDDLLDIYDVRLALETLAARRAAERGGPELAKGLMERFKRIKGRKTDSDWFHDHEEFHLYLFAGAGGPDSAPRSPRSGPSPNPTYGSRSRRTCASVKNPTSSTARWWT